MGNRPSVEPPVALYTLQDQACASTETMTSDDEDKKDGVESKDLTGDEEEHDEPPKRPKALVVLQISLRTLIGKGKGKKLKHAKAEIMEDIMAKAMKKMTLPQNDRWDQRIRRKMHAVRRED